MDAFAENQMGRNDEANSSMLDVTQATAIQAKRLRRSSKEQDIAVEVEVAEELLAPPSAGADGDNDDPMEEVDVPTMSVDDSAIIARKWDRRKSRFMPVADPYGEPDENVSQARLLINAYCTCASLGSAAKRLLFDSIPALSWFPKMTRDTLKSDVIAGCTVGVMLIPQSMSYASIAGLQYKYGLYTSVVPLITYALLGTSRQLGVGPVALVSLLVEVGLKGLLTEEECPEYYAQKNDTSLASEADWQLQSELCPDEYAQLAFLTSFLMGLFQIGAGFLRLGFLVSFLAHPVISGFTSAAAIVIGLSQVQYFMGFKIPKSQYIYEVLIHIFDRIHKTQWEQVAPRRGPTPV